ncbi:MAG: sensor histidine kinase, partial [Chloroflexi bacterium]|nr:sensor histidine kinase [Chloroflexota bacterium]
VLIILDIILSPPPEVPLSFVIINRSYAFLAIGIVVGIGQLQRRLVRQGQRLAALSVVEERERLSRELHDDLSQLLGGLGARASAVSELLTQGHTEEAQRELAQLRNSASEAYLGIRQYITGLRVRLWGDRRFLKALEEFARSFAKQAGLTLKVEVSEGMAAFKLAPAVEIQAIRIVQEALTNTLRHANARTIWLKVNLNETFLQITIQDDGQGFDPTAVDSHSHLGLQMMRERAELVGGQFLIAAAAGSGTSVTLRTPYQKKEV